MLAIITGTINPPAQMGQLFLKDGEERLKQYEDSIRFFIDSGAFRSIVFCENSDHGLEELSCLHEIAEQKKVKLELLSFKGDSEKACIHGKGYGEGEIIDHVFSHSKAVLTEPYFMKITGRLKVDNIKDIVSHMDRSRTYFNIPNRTRRDMYDTRIYGMPAGQFKSLFRNAYDQVWDEQGIFLERVYTQIIRDNRLRIHNFPRYPRIVGVSGTGGVRYDYTEWKCRIRDILSRMEFYRLK